MVKILLQRLGGTNLEDLADKTAIAEDHTATWDAILDRAEGALGAVAEANYKTLKAAGSFEIGDGAYAERYTDSNGVNNTVDIRNSTSGYSSSAHKSNFTAFPKGYWKFSNNLTDLGVIGTLTNVGSMATFTTDKNGVANSALNFNGSNAYLAFNDTVNGFLSGYLLPKYSISFWIKHTSTSGNQPYFPTPAAASGDVISMRNNAGTFQVYSNVTLLTFTPSLPAVTTNWTHIAVTFNATKSTNKLTVYINGTKYDTTGADSRTAWDNYIGLGSVYLFGGSQYFNGVADELAVYNDELTQTQVTNIYNQYNLIYETQSSTIHNTGLALNSSETIASIYANTQGSLINSGTGDGNNDTQSFVKTASYQTTDNIKGIKITAKNNIQLKQVKFQALDSELLGSVLKIYSSAKTLLKTIYPAYEPTNGLKASYHFTGNTNDSSVNGFNLTNNGATLTTDKNGVSNQAYSFNGTSNDMVSTAVIGTTTVANISVAAWVYVAGGDGTNRYIFGTETSGANGWRFYINTSNVLAVQTQGGAYSPVSTTTLNVGNWYHVAFTCDGSGVVRIYVNGSLEATTGGAIGGTTNNNTVKIGSNGNSTGWFNGKIDEYKIYTSYTLNAADIYSLYLNYDSAPTISYTTGTADGADDSSTISSTWSTSAGQTGLYGMSVKVVNSCFLKSVTKEASCTATKAYLVANNRIIASATFSGNTATFGTLKNQFMEQGNVYTILCGSDGSSYTARQGATTTATLNADLLIYGGTADTNGGSATYVNSTTTNSIAFTGNHFNIASFVTQTASTPSTRLITSGIDYTLEAGKSYYLMEDGSAYTNFFPSAYTQTFPDTSEADVDLIGGARTSSITDVTTYYGGITELTTQNITGALTPVTGIKVNCSDGTTTTSDVQVDSKGKAIIDISGLAGGSLKVTAKLETTDTSLTPELYGVGIVIK